MDHDFRLLRRLARPSGRLAANLPITRLSITRLLSTRLLSAGLLSAGLLIAGLLIAGSGPAAAQGISSQLSGPAVPLGHSKDSKADNPPPALPGATGNGADAPALPDRPTAEMAPNDALFDGINRGDIATVRDAMNRGADLNDENVLGLTPIDLSVDLGRNQITFLLLSMRGPLPSGLAGPGAATRPGVLPGRPGARPKTLVASRQAERPDNRPLLRTASRDSSPNSLGMVAEAQPRQTVFNGNPGTPAPQVGFLGFSGPLGR
jgi:hypothetical protein